MNTACATGSSPTTGTFHKVRTLGFFVLVLAVFAATSQLRADDVAPNSDDGWRRTKDGWEHIATWRVITNELPPITDLPLAPAVVSPAAESWQKLHPGILAAGVGLFSCLALRPVRASGRT